MNTRSKKNGKASVRSDLRAVLAFVRDHAVPICLCTAVGTALAMFMFWRTPRVYQAIAVIQVEQQEPNVMKIEAVKNEDLKTVEIFKTFEQTVVSPAVLSHVLEDPQLKADPGFLPEAGMRPSQASLYEALSRHVVARIRRGTRLIDVSVEHTHPAIAKRIADLVIEGFVQWNYATRREVGKIANQYLVREAERLKGRLLASERALQDYKQVNESVSLEDRQTITNEKLKSLNLRVTEAKAERLKFESERAQLANITGAESADLLAIYELANAPGIVELRRSINERETVLTALAQRYKPEHPKYAEAKRELEKVQAVLSSTLRKTAEGLESRYAAAQLNEFKLEGALREQEKIALDLGSVLIPYSGLLRDLESDRTIYQSVLTRLKETDLTKDIGQDAVRLVAAAMLPERPVRPNKKRMLVLGLAGGLLAGVGIGVARQILDNSFKSADEVELGLGIPLLASIPMGKLFNGEHGWLPVISQPASDIAEAFRGLRTSLLLGDDAQSRKVFLLTSALPGEGKSFCAINCAVAFSQQGLKTLIVDADLRRPSLEKLLIGGEPKSGLAEILASSADTPSCIRPSGIEGLWVLGAGKNRSRPAELLAGEGFGAVVQYAKARFERVIINSAPIEVVSDSLLVARHVQTICLVVGVGKVSYDEVQRALERLRALGLDVGGVIVNRVPQTGNRPGGYGAAGYNGMVSVARPSNIMRLPTLVQGTRGPKRGDQSDWES